MEKHHNSSAGLIYLQMTNCTVINLSVLIYELINIYTRLYLQKETDEEQSNQNFHFHGCTCRSLHIGKLTNNQFYMKAAYLHQVYMKAAYLHQVYMKAVYQRSRTVTILVNKLVYISVYSLATITIFLLIKLRFPFSCPAKIQQCFFA